MCTCGLNVLKCDKQEHLDDMHAMIKCEYCDYTDFKYKFKDHEDTWDMRLLEWPFCSIMVKNSEFQVHKDYWGNILYEWEMCSQKVRRGDKAMHEAVACEVTKDMLSMFPGMGDWFDEDD